MTSPPFYPRVIIFAIMCGTADLVWLDVTFMKVYQGGQKTEAFEYPFLFDSKSWQ